MEQLGVKDVGEPILLTDNNTYSVMENFLVASTVGGFNARKLIVQAKNGDLEARRKLLTPVHILEGRSIEDVQNARNQEVIDKTRKGNLVVAIDGMYQFRSLWPKNLALFIEPNELDATTGQSGMEWKVFIVSKETGEVANDRSLLKGLNVGKEFNASEEFKGNEFDYVSLDPVKKGKNHRTLRLNI